MRKLPKRYELCVCGHKRLDHHDGKLAGFPKLAICNPCHMAMHRDKNSKAWHHFLLDGLAYVVLNAKSNTSAK